MTVSKAIKERIMSDNVFSLELAKILGIQQNSLFLLVRRNSDRLKLYDAIEFYKSNGYTEEEIFETEKAN